MLIIAFFPSLFFTFLTFTTIVTISLPDDGPRRIPTNGYKTFVNCIQLPQTSRLLIIVGGNVKLLLGKAADSFISPSQGIRGSAAAAGGGGRLLSINSLRAELPDR